MVKHGALIGVAGKFNSKVCVHLQTALSGLFIVLGVEWYIFPTIREQMAVSTPYFELT